MASSFESVSSARAARRRKKQSAKRVYSRRQLASELLEGRELLAGLVSACDDIGHISSNAFSGDSLHILSYEDGPRDDDGLDCQDRTDGVKS